jgi:MSHA pilin protein MshC
MKSRQAHPNTDRRGASRGFTLVELVTIMIIIGILAAVAAPKMLDMTGSSAESGHAAEIRANLAHARKTAVAARRYVCVAVASNTVTITMDAGDPDVAASPTCTLPVPLPAGATDGVLTSPSGVTVTSTAASFHFTPSGEASANATLSVGSQSVSVAAITGRVS